MSEHFTTTALKLDTAEEVEPDFCQTTAFDARTNRYTPEYALIRAVLLDAISILRLSNYRKNLTYKREVEVWLDLEEHDRPYGFGFVCDVLGLDPAATRAFARSTGAISRIHMVAKNRGGPLQAKS